MLPCRHSSAPKFNPQVSQQYFQELKMLFGPAQIIKNIENKKHACQYVNIDTANLWELIPEFNVTQTFKEFKSAVHKLYLGSKSECK
jgi:hypothetical protein